MSTYTDNTPYKGNKPVYIVAKTVPLQCKSEMCRNRTTKHVYNRTTDDGREMYVCCTCGEERTK